jgi:hypothetical protein
MVDCTAGTDSDCLVSPSVLPRLRVLDATSNPSWLRLPTGKFLGPPAPQPARRGARPAMGLTTGGVSHLGGRSPAMASLSLSVWRAKTTSRSSAHQAHDDAGLPRTGMRR